MQIGDIRLTVLNDGKSVVPGHFFGPVDGPHADLVDEHGMITLPIAAFLLQIGGKNVLLDAGMGPASFIWNVPNGDRLELSGGALPHSLAQEGLSPEDIDFVIPTHLHGDHVGWLFPEGRDFFPNAIIRFGEGDWEPWVESAPNPHLREGMRKARDHGRVRYIEGDCELLPGLNALATPGHSPGHMCYMISSGTERALMLGDAISCPLQLQNPEFEIAADADPKLAIRMRDRIFREIEGTNAMVGGPHFPELRLGRVLMGEGRRYWS